MFHFAVTSFWQNGHWYPSGDLRGNILRDIFGRTITIGSRIMIPALVTATDLSDTHGNTLSVVPIFPARAGFGSAPPIPAETIKVHPLQVEVRN